MPFKNIVTLLCLWSSAEVLTAQNDLKAKQLATTLVTDRPDATESPTTVFPGFIQVETGGAYEKAKRDNVKEERLTYNTTLIRLGLVSNVELRLGWDISEGIRSVNGKRLEDVSSSFTPLLLGTKVAIAEEKGVFPEIGLLGHVYLPFLASTDYRPDTTGVDFLVAFAHTLSDTSSLGYNLGAIWEDDFAEPIYTYSLSYGHAITDELGAYLEAYGTIPENLGTTHYWDTGLTYLVSQNMQLDATVGSAIQGDQELLLSAGISIKIPTK